MDVMKEDGLQLRVRPKHRWELSRFESAEICSRREADHKGKDSYLGSATGNPRPVYYIPTVGMEHRLNRGSRGMV